ncbi:MAG: hypothetical protein JWM78_486 [Verrucomicrobiaceae bacterium]|nr:hypothetical protein [Verrucomicrobiaceae bacterium]
MNTGIDGINAAQEWFDLIDVQLRDIFAKLEQYFDISPAQCFRLEGIVAAAHCDGIALDELLQFCQRNVPPNCSVRIEPHHRLLGNRMLQFNFWQKRAPVN